MARIAVGGFLHESNTFAPQRAAWDEFARADAWPGFVRGPELLDAFAGYNVPIAGAIETLRGKGHELLPLCWCSAPPSSYVESGAFERVAAAMVRHASAMIGYRTYPHVDLAATGGRAAELLLRLIAERRPLHKAYRQIDFLIPLVWQCTEAERPLRVRAAGRYRTGRRVP